jgi:hypothetical protein
MFARRSQTPPIVHQEEPFDDFAAQPLLPYRLSEPGPALAWGDIDADGDIDAFLGGARTKPGRLLVNDGSGSFSQVTSPAFATVLQSEAAAAALFDADGDADLDLYVATGSVERPADDAAYRDELYLNDGGQFTRAPADALPDLRDSGSVVAPADYDQDGDVDLFVGSRSVPGKYPTSPENRLLVNEGGKFRDAAPDELRRAGMVTDAAWADLDGDGGLELVLATDWGPVRLFTSRQGQFAELTQEAGLAALTGWWLSVAPGDVDGDGDADLVVGNFGRNTPYRATPEQPVELYYGDVEGLGTPVIIETIAENGRVYPRREFPALAAALPTLQQKYATFREYGAATLEEIFGAEQLAKAERFTAATLDSGVLVNEGGLKFRFVSLPDIAQAAPVLEAALTDVDGDGLQDVALAQNLFGTNSELGRFDGAMSLLLQGEGDGQLQPLAPAASGIIVPGQARRVDAVDLNGDRRPDLVFGVHGELAVYLNATP